uniref:Calponin-homology (CH) domain-containing protein n=1 Tax=Angiostrongylus cantonensis TaxID=6313 RepID=A0A158P8N0_ANGCA
MESLWKQPEVPAGRYAWPPIDCMLWYIQLRCDDWTTVITERAEVRWVDGPGCPRPGVLAAPSPAPTPTVFGSVRTARDGGRPAVARMSRSPTAPSPCCVCFTSARNEEEQAQKNTFTKWINLHLEEHSSSGRVNDLFEDIKDGVLLCHLIEVLTGEALSCRAVDYHSGVRGYHSTNLSILKIFARESSSLVRVG